MHSTPRARLGQREGEAPVAARGRDTCGSTLAGVVGVTSAESLGSWCAARGRARRHAMRPCAWGAATSSCEATWAVQGAGAACVAVHGKPLPLAAQHARSSVSARCVRPHLEGKTLRLDVAAAESAVASTARRRDVQPTVTPRGGRFLTVTVIRAAKANRRLILDHTLTTTVVAISFLGKAHFENGRCDNSYLGSEYSNDFCGAIPTTHHGYAFSSPRAHTPPPHRTKRKLSSKAIDVNPALQRDIAPVRDS